MLDRLEAAITLTRLLVFLLLIAAQAFAADMPGKWTASFNARIGVQNYVYSFKVAGAKLTGTAKPQFGEAEIQEGSTKGGDISFVGNLKFQEMMIRIEYKGKLYGGEIRFTRKMGDFAPEELGGKREKGYFTGPKILAGRRSPSTQVYFSREISNIPKFPNHPITTPR